MKRIALLLVMSGILGACSENVTPSTSNKPATSNIRSDAAVSTTLRKCTANEMEGVTEARLGDFFGKVVRNMEGPATYCLQVLGGGTDVRGSWLRIEYEDDFGIRAYETDHTNGVFTGSVKITDTSTNIEVIFIDNYGLIQVKGSAPASSSTFSGTVKYYNFPSFEEQLNQQMQDAANKCKSGTYTVAQCLGYNFPQAYWWNQTNASASNPLVDQAHQIFADPNKSKQLGTVSVGLTEILSQ